MLFKSVSYLEALFSGPELLVQFSRRYHEEQFCEIILNLDQRFRRICILKVFLIWSSYSPFVQRSETIFAIVEEGIIRNNSVK